MNEREAIAVFDDLRRALRSISPQAQVQAQNVLGQAHVIPSALMYEIPRVRFAACSV